MAGKIVFSVEREKATLGSTDSLRKAKELAKSAAELEPKNFTISTPTGETYSATIAIGKLTRWSMKFSRGNPAGWSV